MENYFKSIKSKKITPDTSVPVLKTIRNTYGQTVQNINHSVIKTQSIRANNNFKRIPKRGSSENYYSIAERGRGILNHILNKREATSSYIEDYVSKELP